MPWFKIDDGFHSHPKILEAGNEAIGLYVRCGSYCSQHLTEGFVPRAVALMYGSVKQVQKLVAAGLFVPAEDGWHIHDYLVYNPARKQVLAEREASAERQRNARERARQAREEAARKATQAKSHADSHGVTDGVTHTGSHGPRASRSPRPDPTRPVLPTEVLGESAERDNAPGPPQSQAPAKPKREPKRATEAPDSFPVTDGMAQWAMKEHRLSRQVIEFQTTRFLDHHRARGNTFKDWTAAWRTWISRVNEYAPQAASTQTQSPSAPNTPWCGRCERLTREIENDRDQLIPCPTCSPHRRKP